MMYGHGQSDRPIVPRKAPNKPVVEGRCGGAGGKGPGQGEWAPEPTALDTVPEYAKVRRLGSIRWRYAHRIVACANVTTQGKSRMRENRPSGSVRGAARKGRPYLDW